MNKRWTCYALCLGLLMGMIFALAGEPIHTLAAELDTEFVDTEDLEQPENSEESEEPENPEEPELPDEPVVLPDLDASATLLERKGATYNINQATKQSVGGYSVLQGACTDGDYAYYVMLKKTTSAADCRCKILKTKLKSNRKVLYSESLNLGHGNDITYDSERNRLIVVHYDPNPFRLSIVNPETLTVEKRFSLKLPETIPGATQRDYRKITGITAIAYSPERNQYVVKIKASHNYLILNKRFKPIQYVKVTDSVSGTSQGIDADADYIYALKSHSGAGNSISVYDWEGNYLYKINIPVYYEGESLFHVEERFYMGTYRSYMEYYYTTHYKTKRVKWKKVDGKWVYKNKYVYQTKKKKVRWKKVDGKWTYKTKKYKVRATYKVEHARFSRANYVYRVRF